MRAVVLPFGVLLMAMAGPALAASPEPLVPRFVEETAQSGIETAYAGEWQYMVGGGLASFDCDANGFPDVLVAGGAAPAGFYVNRSTVGGPLRFEKTESGLELDAVTGAYPLDVDADGNTDLVLLRVGENVVMRGLGGCRFERANEAWGFDGGDAWSTAFAATWERDNAWPTLAVGNYVDRKEEAFPWGSCTANWLHRPQATERRFAPPVPLTPSFCALSMLFTDWNRSGVPSLRVSNDREYYKGGQEQMWHVEPGAQPKLYTPEEGWKFLRIWGMGIAGYDLDSNGYPEYFLTSMADNKLQKLAEVPETKAPVPSYADVAYAAGVTAHRPYTGGDWHPSTAWHPQFEDVNNDGRVDLFVAKGNVAEMPDFAMKDPNNLLLQQDDGKFVEAGDKAGIADFANSRGAAVADFNLDGLVDLVVVNRWERPHVWRNATPDAGNFVALRLDQQGGNREAVGAWVEVRCGDDVMRRELTVGGGHVSGHSGWMHFGAHDFPEIDLRVVWPDGSSGDWQRVLANAFYVVKPGAAPEPWSPAR